MPTRKIQFTAVDDGVHVKLDINEWRLVGSTWVAEGAPLRIDILSFPGGSLEDWRRDMAVLFVERL